MSGGLLHARGQDRRTLAFAAVKQVDGKSSPDGFYEMDATMTLRRIDDAGAAWCWGTFAESFAPLIFSSTAPVAVADGLRVESRY